jgi:DNA invertase Pin-like site-specific DNA recombinase
MRRAYSYVRFSTPEQLKGDSLRRQLQMSHEYAEKNDLLLDDAFHLRDLGISAFRGKNAKQGALGAFLDAINQGKVAKGSVLLIESLDRLSRDTVDEALSLFLGILKSGIDITTMTPLREYTKESIKHPMNLMEPLFIMARANEESAMKASRLKGAWRGKRENIGSRKLTARIPAWLTINQDRTGFEVRRESVEVVRRIFQWVSDGMGINTITKRLNEANIHNFGNRSKTGWHRSYVLKIIRNRAVLGEFQPHTQEEGGRKPIGEVIPNYYPAIVSEALFYKAQQGLDSRRNQMGPRGKGVANLFTGLLFDARDGLPMNLVNKGKKSTGLKLVSSGAIRGVPGSVYRSFSYRLFEDSFLRAMMELQLSDFTADTKATEDRLGDLDAQISDVDARIEKTQQAAESADDFGSLLKLLQKLGSRRNTLVVERERLQAETSTKGEDALADVQFMVEGLANVEGEERERLREKLKAKIRVLIGEIWMLVHGQLGEGTGEVQVFYRNSKWKVILIDEASGNMLGHAHPKEEALDPAKDLRNYREATGLADANK